MDCTLCCNVGGLIVYSSMCRMVQRKTHEQISAEVLAASQTKINRAIADFIEPIFKKNQESFEKMMCDIERDMRLTANDEE